MSWPLIGVLGGFRERADKLEDEYHLNARYIDAVAEADGIPLLLAPCLDNRQLAATLGRLGGLLVSGGPDLPPRYFGQDAHPETRPMHFRRADFDWRCVNLALKLEKPVLAVCYGAQLLNVIFGGTLIQDIPSQRPSQDTHRAKHFEARHPVRVEPDTRLRQIMLSDTIEVNSAHHQAIDRVGNGLRVNAWTVDGLPEGIELPGARFVLGVQWHPEEMPDRPEQARLFRALVDEAYRKGDGVT